MSMLVKQIKNFNFFLLVVARFLNSNSFTRRRRDTLHRGRGREGETEERVVETVVFLGDG